MSDWNKPTTSSDYADFVTELDDRLDDLALAFDGRTVTNLPTGAIRFNSATLVFEKWDGSAWAALDTKYALKDAANTWTAAQTISASFTVDGGNITVDRTGDAVNAVTDLKADTTNNTLVRHYRGSVLRASWYYAGTGEQLIAVVYDDTGASAQSQITVAHAGAVTLGFAGSAKLATKVDGVSVTGDLSATTATLPAASIDTLTTNQVAFPATQVPSADANTLDDYEEGIFTPVVQGTTTAGAGTYSAQVGRYTKVGRVVHFSLYIDWTAHTGTGNLRVSGLPFTAAAVTNNKPPVPVWAANLTFSGQLCARLNNNATTIDLRTIATGAADSAVAIDTAAQIAISGSYEAA